MANATELLHIPFNAGAHEEADRKLLPQGLLKRAENVRLRRSGALGVRYGYAAQPNTDDEGSALTVYDVASHGGALLAFGSTISGAGGPTRVHTLTGGAWRAEDRGDGRERAFSAVSDVRQVYRPTLPALETGQAVAYAGGYVALVWESPLLSLTIDLYGHVAVFDPVTGSEILAYSEQDRFIPDVIAVGDVFVFVWLDASNDVRARSFDPASDTALGTETVIASGGGGTIVTLHAAPVSGSSTEFIVAYEDGGVGRLLRLNLAFSVLATGTVTGAVSTPFGLVELSGEVHVAHTVSGPNAVRLETFDTATLSSTTGPTTLASLTLTTTTVGMGVRDGELVVSYVERIGATADDIATLAFFVDPATHAVSSSTSRPGVFRESAPFTSADDQFTGVFASATVVADTDARLFAVADLRESQGLECALARGFGEGTSVSPTTRVVASDGARYWAVLMQREAQGNFPVVVEFRVNSPERRQTASLGGLLYIAGGYLGLWDGQRLTETGYLERPVIYDISDSGTGGSLASGATYSWVAVFEYLDAAGNRHLSEPSDPVSYSSTATAKDLIVSTPLSVRGLPATGGNATLLLYRTLAAPDRTHRLTAAVPLEVPAGELVTVTDGRADSDIRDQEVVYTQGARGSLSGPLPHQPPEPARYVWASRDRLALGGLPFASKWQQSKRLFPAEPMQFSSALGFFGSIRGDVTAVASQDGLDYVFSRNEIFVIEGAGPDDNGNGEFASPRKLPGDDVGCIDWRSVVASAAGIWFQASPDRLYLLPRGGGAPEWAGQPVRETLAAFPVVTAAAVVSNDNVVCWAVQNAAGSAGRLVCHDTRSGEWYVDTLSDLGGPITAMCEHESRLAVVVGGRVYLQDTTFPASTFLAYGVTTGSVAPFGADAHGRLVSVTVAAEYRGDCQVQASVSYDDEGSFTAIGTPFAVSSLSSGDTVELQWWPLRRKGSRFTLRFEVTAPSGGAATEGLLLNNLTLEVQSAKRARRATSGERR